MKSIQLRRNITIIFSTFFAVIVVYLFYTQIYTKSREEHLIQTRFRVLDLMGDNVESKVASYQSNVKTYEEEVLNSMNVKSLEKIDKRSIDSTITTFKKVLNPDLKFSNKLAKSHPLNIDIRRDSVIISYELLEFYLPAEFLLKNIDRNDVFEQTIIIGDTTIIYSSLAGDLKLVRIDPEKEGAKIKSLNFKNAAKSDTLFLPIDGKLKATAIQSNQCYNISLSDGPYKLFLKGIKIGQDDWFIGGLVKTADFQREKQSTAPWFIIILSLVLLLIVLSLPFVKLKVMSRTEMLGTGTVMYAGFAFVLGASFIIHFLFFQAYNLNRRDDNDENLTKFSAQIKGSFSEELKKIYRQLDDVEGEFRKDIERNPIKENFILNNPSWKTDQYPYFDYIYMLDSNGAQISQITPFSFKEKFDKYPNRDYFKLKDEWYWPYGSTEKYKKFRMESIVSLTSGDYKVAFSRPSDPEKKWVFVMTGRFYSLIDPIIPKGYKFCIIDKTGKVWFHSNKYQNQAENFIQECDGDKLLKAALYADVTKSMTVNYYNHPHRIHIETLEPSEGIPLYLISLLDLRTEYSYQAQVFTTTLILIVALFIYLLIQVLILFLLKGFFRTDQVHGHFQFDFINLRNSKMGEYNRLILYFVLALLVFWFIIIPMPGLMAIISIFIIVTILITNMFIHLQTFKSGSPARYIFIIINALIVIGLFFQLYPEVNNSTAKYFWSILIMSILLATFPFVKFGNLFDSLNLKPDVRYSLFILLLVILFGVAPILKFFDISANIENNVNIRYGQLELARMKEARNINFSKYYTRIDNFRNTGGNEARDNAHRTRRGLGIYTDFWYQTKLGDAPVGGLPVDAEVSDRLDSMINIFRPVYNDDFSVVSKYLFIDSVENRSFKWQQQGNTSLMLNYKSPTEDINRQEVKSEIISSTVPSANIFYPFTDNPKTNGVFSRLLLYLILAGILILFFKLILFTTRKVYGISLISDFEKHDFKSEVSRQLADGNSLMLINPSAFIGFHSLVKKIKADFLTIDFKWNESENKNISKIYLVKDLAKDYHEPEKFEEKLNTLISWMLNTGKLIILMETNPEVISYYYSTKTDFSKSSDPKGEKKTDDKTENFRKTFHLFKIFMKRLVVTGVPINYVHSGEKSEESVTLESDGKKIDNDLENLISRELGASAFLARLKEPIIEYVKSLDDPGLSPDEKRSMTLNRIGEMADNYYPSLMETCTPEEKFVLLDLAFDSIANIKNKHVVIKLLRKGLLVKGKDAIILMNMSFRLFLLSHYSMDDKHEFKKAMVVGPSNWTGYKFAILLVIIAIFVFIFISNQEFLQNMNKLFITLGASIAGISSLMGLLGRKSKE